MTPEKCPGCGIKLQPDMLVCPNCPMSFPEGDGGKVYVNPIKHSPYYKFLFPALFLGAVGAMVWFLGMGLMRLGLANNQIENGNLFGEKTKAAPPSATSGAAARGGAGDASADSGRPAEAAPADEGLVVISRVDEDGKPKAANEWKLRGMVYDLTTLKPLAGCVILFTDEKTNRSIRTVTDSTGRYHTIVPPLNGESAYSVTVEKNGYAPDYLDPATEGVREMGAGVRTGMARGLAATLTAAPAFVRGESGKPLVTDFYLAPRP